MKQGEILSDLIKECKFIDNSFLIGFDRPDFKYILNEIEFKCLVEKQKFKIEKNLNDIIKELCIFFNYTLAYCEINHMSKNTKKV